MDTVSTTCLWSVSIFIGEDKVTCITAGTHTLETDFTGLASSEAKYYVIG
jgi:hypothetical protein